MTFSLLRGDARTLPLADDTVDLIVTSPPYFALRGYTDAGEVYDGQVGNEPTMHEFVDALVECTAEMARVLKPTGSIFVNLGDKYGSGARTTYADDAKHAGRRGDRTPDAHGKSLMGIPWRYALRCMDDLGLILRAEIVWAKPNGMPESVKDRVRRSHEQWFHFTLRPSYYFGVDRIREPHAESSIARSQRQRLAPDLAQPDWSSPNTLDPTQAVDQLGRMPGSWWEIATEPLRVPDELDIDHFAAFPTEWPRRLILGWSPTGICTVCGHGRFPVRRTPKGGDNNPYSADGSRAKSTTTWRAEDDPVRIIGEACECTPRRKREPTGDWRAGRAESPTHLNGFDQGSGNAVPRRTDLTPPDEPLWTYMFDGWDPAPTTPAVVLDPFMGTGTTVAVAHLLGRHGVGVDLSADYLRLAGWRCTGDRLLRNRVLDRTGIPNPKPPTIPDQLDLFAGT